MLLHAGLLTFAIAWLHCPGMCGPLLWSFGFGAPTPGQHLGRSSQCLRASSELLAYQGGRALLYAGYGALAGALGAGLTTQFDAISRIAVLVVAAGLLAMAAAPLWMHTGAGTPNGRAARLIRWLLSRVPKAQPQDGSGKRLLRAASLGAALSVLPCGVTFMVLGLAAASASPWLGAALLLVQVLATTPVLLLVVLLPRLRAATASQRRWALPTVQVAGAVWLLLIGSAANGWISHAHLPLGGDHALMLW